MLPPPAAVVRLAAAVVVVVVVVVVIVVVVVVVVVVVAVGLLYGGFHRRFIVRGGCNVCVVLLHCSYIQVWSVAFGCGWLVLCIVLWLVVVC